MILGASLVAGFVWWVGNPLNQSTRNRLGVEPWLIQNPIWIEAAVGVAMLLMAFLTFSIRSQLLIL